MFYLKHFIRYNKLYILNLKYGIKPEELPPSEDIKKLERRVKTQEKKIAEQSGRFPVTEDNEEE